MLSNEPTYEKEESKRKTIFLPELSNCRPKSAGGGKFAEKFAEKEKIYKFAFVSSFRQSVFQLKKPFKVVAGPGRQTYKDVT